MSEIEITSNMDKSVTDLGSRAPPKHHNSEIKVTHNSPGFL